MRVSKSDVRDQLGVTRHAPRLHRCTPGCGFACDDSFFSSNVTQINKLADLGLDFQDVELI